MIDGYSSLPPKPPPVSAWMTRACQAERSLERLVDVVRALQRAVDDDPAVLAGHGDHRVVLDVQLLLVADPVGALDDQVGGGEPRVKVVGREPSYEAKTWSDAIGVEDRRQGLCPRLDPALEPPQRLLVRRGEQRDRLRVVPDLASDRDEDRLVVLDRRDDVVARDVGGGRDDDLRPVDVGVELDRDQLRVGLGGADGDAVPGAGEDQVVGVLGGAGELRRTSRSRSGGRPVARPGAIVLAR